MSELKSPSESKSPSQLKPLYDEVQAIYDEEQLTELLSLFLDPTLQYSCAYFERDDMTLEEAQYAKIDLALGKIDLQPGQKVVEIGCGWGTCLIRAAEKHQVDIIGLTLSENQRTYALEKLTELPSEVAEKIEVRLQGWEEFDEPVDRIVSIAAFEHFRIDRYAAFFERCHKLLPAGGKMLLHTIVWFTPRQLEEKGLTLTHEDVLFNKFMQTFIFPRGQLAPPDFIAGYAERAGFKVDRIHSLGKHYARTLSIWAENLKAAREQAIALKSEEVYENYMKYLTGCSGYFESGHIDIVQFTLSV